MASQRQSLKHGLTSSTLVVLPEEHEHEYQEVLRGFRESFNPADPAEEALVLRLAQAHWRSLRSRRVETAIYHVTANAQRDQARELVENCPEHLNPHEAIAVAFMTMPADHWQKYLRYDTTISRDFFKTLEALQKLQRTRQQRACGAGSKPAKASQAAAPLTMVAGRGSLVSENGIRSVSQNTTGAPNSNEDNESTTPTATFFAGVSRSKTEPRSAAPIATSASSVSAFPTQKEGRFPHVIECSSARREKKTCHNYEIWKSA